MRLHQRSLVKPMRQRLAALLAFGLAIALTALISHSLFHDATAQQESDGPTVRISALKSESGSVRVALQRQGAGGSWGERQHPDLNRVGAMARTGVWLNSSPLQLEAAAAPEYPGQLGQISFFCLVTHEHPGDEAFWNLITLGATRFQSVVGVTVEVKAGPTAAQQAQHIRDCVADGADGIATSLPDPEGLGDAIAEARSAGVALVSFNSGLNSFAALGSSRHHSVDEVAAGEEAGRRLNDHGVSGTVLCIVHEPANIGLEERCQGLEDGYDGKVERLSVADTGVGDIAGSTATLAARLQAADDSPPIAGIVALNTQIGLAAREAVAETGVDAVVVTFDQNNDVLEAIKRGEILFAIDTLPTNQSWYALTSLLALVFIEDRARNVYGVEDPNLIAGQVAMPQSPRVFTKANADAWLAVNQRAAEGE